jgi:hypothetical protein
MLARMTKRGILVATAGLLLIFPMLEQTVKRPAITTAAEHYEHLTYLRANPDIWKEPTTHREYFRLSTFRHYAAGKPSLKQYLDQCEEHQLALIKAGVYERREFKLERGLNASFVTNFLNTISNSAVEQSWFMNFDDSKTNSVRITCRKLDMPLVSRVIRRVESPR